MTPLLFPNRLNFIRQLPQESIGAEVGVCRGEFSRQILDSMPLLKTLHLVDAWKHLGGAYEHDPENVDDGGHEARYAQIRERFANDSRVQIHRELSTWAPFVCGITNIDWCYIDAAHDYDSVIKDLFAWSSLNPKIIIGHDYRTDAKTMKMRFGVVEAVTVFCRMTDYKLTKLTLDEWPSYWLEKP